MSHWNVVRNKLRCVVHSAHVQSGTSLKYWISQHTKILVQWHAIPSKLHWKLRQMKKKPSRKQVGVIQSTSLQPNASSICSNTIECHLSWIYLAVVSSCHILGTSRLGGKTHRTQRRTHWQESCALIVAHFPSKRLARPLLSMFR